MLLSYTETAFIITAEMPMPDRRRVAMTRDTWDAAIISIREVKARRDLTPEDQAFWFGFLYAIMPAQGVTDKDMDDAVSELGLPPDKQDYFMNDLYVGDSLLEAD